MIKIIKNILFFLSFTILFCQEIPDTLILCQEQEEMPDTLFIEHINFSEKVLLSNNQLFEKRKDYQLNFEYQNNISNIRIDYNSLLENSIKKYQNYQWLPKIYALLSFYEPMFKMIFNSYGLPTDLIYLSLIESNLNPQAGSWVGASGLWQFMPLTGKNFGLSKNNYINLFYDPVASTIAACRYLKKLYEYFHDWNLVISAYNCGEGRVLSSIKKAGSKNYWQVRNFLPQETKDYVIKFHTVKYLHLLYPVYFGVEYYFNINYSDIKEFNINYTTTFKELCKKNNLDLNLTYFLNPHIVTEIIPKNIFIYYIK